MKKRSLAFVLLLIPQLIFAIQLNQNSQIFEDVLNNNENYEAINYVKNNNIVSGYKDGTFKPEKKINRAELTKIIIGSTFSEEEINKCNLLSLNFKDVPSNAWFAPFICIAKEKNIIEGYDDKFFKPSQNVTFVETAKIAASIFTQELPETDSKTWFEPFVRYLSSQSAIPYAINDLGKKVTRGDVSEIIYRLHSKNTEKPSLKFINGKLIKKSTTEVQEVPQNCQHWYDGCNECYRSDIGAPLKCTKKSCQAQGTAGCRFSFPAPIKILPLPTLTCKSWTDGINTCSRENLGDAPLCTDEVKAINVGTQSIRCTQEFKTKLLPEVGIKENSVYKLVSPANLAENLGEKAIALYFQSFENCILCNATDSDISKNLDNFPKNSLILKVQFDTDQYKELKEKFEITEPNTVVIIDKNKRVSYKATDFSIDELNQALKNALK